MPRRIAVLAVSLLTACAPPPPATAAQPPAPPAVDEQTREEIRELTEAIAQQPTNMPWIYLLATAYDRARDADNVVKWLKRLDELGWEHGAAAHAFRHTSTPAFREIVARLEAREPSSIAPSARSRSRKRATSCPKASRGTPRPTCST